MPRRLLALIALPAALPWLGAPAEAVAAPAPTVVEVVKVEGPIDAPLIGYVEEQLDRAESIGALVVLQVNTAGTLDEDGLALADRVANLDVPVVAWVGPAPSRASGAGLLLMYAASLAAVYPGSQTGPLFPLDLAAPDVRPPGLEGTIEGWLAKHGRTGVVLDRPDVPLTGAQAVADHVAAFGSVSIPDLLDRLDGRSLYSVAGPVTLHTHVATTPAQAREGTVEIRFENLGPVRRVLHAVSTPTAIYVLLVIGVAAVAFELTQPAFGFAGILGGVSIALSAYGLTVVPVSWLGMGLLLGGLGLLAADVLLRRLGALTALGLAAFVAGSWLCWRGVAPPIRLSSWWIAGAAVAAFLYYGFGLTVAQQSRSRIVNTQRGLIGLVGEARGPLSPEGPVFVKGALWRGRSGNGEIPKGARVRVKGVDGLILRVDREPDPGTES